MPTSLHELMQEAEQKNPQIAASFHAWQASRNVPKQVSALPETQLSVQQFSVGSPRPFAGYSNSDFAYIGFGASQDIPYPGKRHCAPVLPNTKRTPWKRRPIPSAERWWEISRWSISAWPTFSKPSEFCREVMSY